MTCKRDPLLVGVELDHLDGAVGGAHAAADGASLEGRPCGRCRGEDRVAVAEHDLAVGADVDEQPGALVAVHAGGEHARDDVAAHIGAERGEHHGAGARVEVQPDVLGEYDGWLRAGHHERRHAERLGVDAERQRGHRRVAGDRHLVDVCGVDTALDAHLLGQLVEGLAGQ